MKIETKVAKFILLPLFLILLSQSSAFALKPSKVFYESLLQAIRTANGNVLLYFSGGYWSTKAGNDTIIWNVDEGTRAVVAFDYKSGVLSYAKISFKPAVHIWAKGNTNFSAGISEVVYDQYGDATPKFVNDNPSARNSNKALVLARALRFKDRPVITRGDGTIEGGLFVGTPFAFLKAFYPCDKDGKITGPESPMITEVRIRKNVDEGNERPGLKVTFTDDKSLVFAEDGKGKKSEIKLQSGSQIDIDTIDYLVQDGSVSGSISAVELALKGGIIQNDNLVLDITPGTTLSFTNISLSKDGDLISSGGHLNATLNKYAKITLAKKDIIQEYITFNDGSILNSDDFALSVQNNDVKVTFGGNSKLAIRTLEGKLKVGQKGYLSFSTGTLDAKLKGSWDSSQKNSENIDIQQVALIIDKGELPLNENSLLYLGAGTVKGRDLVIKNDGKGLIGTFTELSTTVMANSIYEVPNGIVLITNDGGKVIAATPSSPLSLQATNDYPVGSISLSIPIKEMKNNRLPSFTMKQGKAAITFVIADDGSITSTGGRIEGNAAIKAEVQGKTSELKLYLTLYDININRKKGADAHAEAKVSGDISANLQYVYKFPENKSCDGDKHEYPVTFKASLPIKESIPVSKMSLAGSSFSFTSLDNNAIKIPLKIALEIPPGRGSHDDDTCEESTADGTHGPDDYKNKQEVFTDKYFDITTPWVKKCRFHLFINPLVLPVTGFITMTAEGKSVNIKLEKLTMPGGIALDTNGCSVDKAIIDGVAAFVRVLGVDICGSVQECITMLANKGIQNILNKEHSWTFEL